MAHGKFETAILDAIIRVRTSLTDTDGLWTANPATGKPDESFYPLLGLLTIASLAVNDAAQHEEITTDQYLDKLAGIVTQLHPAELDRV